MAEPFKNMFAPPVVEELADRVAALAPTFDADAFRADVLADLEQLELKARVQRITLALHDHLHLDYPQALDALTGLMGPPADLSQKNQFDFRLWPVTDYVARYGLDHVDRSLEALHALTQRFTAEFAIRPYLREHPDRTMSALQQWVTDDSPHVRRLVSEGTRPRLPWGGRLRAFQRDPTPTIALLDQLVADPQEYVRRSVANHLGDIAKDHPQRAVDVARRWQQEHPGEQTRALVRHALRHLVKKGDRAALRAIGRDPDVDVVIEGFTASPRVVLGGKLELAFAVHNQEAAPVTLELDFVVHFRKASGSLSPKTFKGSVFDLAAGASRAMTRNIPLRDVTTRRHHAGRHRVEVQVNGQVLAGQDFELELAEG